MKTFYILIIDICKKFILFQIKPFDFYALSVTRKITNSIYFFYINYMVFWYLSDSLSFYNLCSGKENMNSKLTFNLENLYVGVCYEQMPTLVSVRLLSDFMAQWYFTAYTISQLLTSKKVWLRGLWSHKKLAQKLDH